MKRKKLIEKLLEQSWLLSDAAVALEELGGCKRRIGILQRDCRDLLKELAEARAGKEPISNALAVCNAELAISKSHCAAIDRERDEARRAADELSKALNVSKNAHSKLGDELHEARETITELNGYSRDGWLKLEALLDDGSVITLLKRMVSDDDDAPYVAVGNSTAVGEGTIESCDLSIAEALSSLVDNLTAEEKP